MANTLAVIYFQWHTDKQHKFLIRITGRGWGNGVLTRFDCSYNTNTHNRKWWESQIKHHPICDPTDQWAGTKGKVTDMCMQYRGGETTRWLTGAGMGGTWCMKGGKSNYLQDGSVKKLHFRVKTCTHSRKQTQTETTHHPTSWLMLGGVISELWKDRWIQPTGPPVATTEKLKQLTSVKSCYAESPPCSAFGFCSRRNTQRAIVTERAQVSMTTLKQ